MGGWIWATAEDLARNKPVVQSVYRSILRALNTERLPLTLAARETAKVEARYLFNAGAPERSLHNIRELLDISRHALSVLQQGEVPGKQQQQQ
ncbi:unnamed protein product [Calypogeia fissa]